MHLNIFSESSMVWEIFSNQRFSFKQELCAPSVWFFAISSRHFIRMESSQWTKDWEQDCFLKWDSIHRVHSKEISFQRYQKNQICRQILRRRPSSSFHLRPHGLPKTQTETQRCSSGTRILPEISRHSDVQLLLERFWDDRNWILQRKRIRIETRTSEGKRTRWKF